MKKEGHGFSKLAAVIGGLLISAGIVLLGIAILGSLGYMNVGLLLENRYSLIFAAALVVVGLFDVVAAVVIARW